MKNLIFLNRSGMSPEVTCRKGRHAIDSILSRFCVVSLICLLMLTLGVGNAWGADTYTMKTSGGGSTTIETNWTANTAATFNASGAYWACGSTTNTFTITSGSGVTGTITKVQVTGKRNKNKAYTINCTVGGSALGSQYSHNATSGNYDTGNQFYNSTGLTGTIVITVSASGGSATDDKGSFWITSIIVTTASCGANPTAGTASLNSSISLSSFPVQTTGWTVGSNCAWTDFGFVWSSSVSTPTLESNGTASSGCTKIQKATSGTSTSTTHSITGSFSTGNSYYVRGYGKNGYASGSYQYTSVLTIVPRSIAFTVNGGSAVSTIYVNSGTAASAPTAPTKTGYTFGGWYQEPTLENAVNWSSNITANKTYYAKWTANIYSVVFNKNNNDATGTMSNESFTYGVSKALTACAFSLVGYTFAGWATTPGGTVEYSDGQSVSNLTATNSGTFNLYAKWNAKSFSVTWMVNGSEWSGKGGSTSVNFGSRISTLPTAPTTSDGCGDKFMGWTTVADYVHGTSPLFTTAGTAPLISAEGNVIYYAVFADYAD